MNSKTLSHEKSLAAFIELDLLLEEKTQLILGGGGALVLAYNFPLATEDLDAFSREKTLPSFQLHIETVSKKLGLPIDWLNPYYSSFTHVLPKDYSSRLRKVFSGSHLRVDALGPEDLLIMKCFAGRDKDIPHAKALLKQKDIQLEIVEDRFSECLQLKIAGTQKAVDFFDDITEGL